MKWLFPRPAWIEIYLGTVVFASLTIACSDSGNAATDARPQDATWTDAVCMDDGYIADGGKLSVPEAPANLDATAVSSSRIDLTWKDRSDNETAFVIDIATQDATFEEIGRTQPNVSSFSVENLTAQTWYRFQVRAVNEAGRSEGSNVAEATTMRKEWTCPGQVISIPSPGPGQDIAPSIQDAIDMHESRGGSPGNSNYLSSRAVEAYHNDLINTKFRNGDPIGNDTDIDDLNDLVGYAIGFRGGEGIAYDNNIVGYCYAILLITYVNDFDPSYPIFTQIGYQSGLDFGESHQGIDAAHGAGDFFEWNNTWVSYTSPNYPDGVSPLENHSPDYLREGRDYHPETQKPGYASFPYPHPDRWF